MTANLQTGLTVKQAARLMNVSERSVYNARKLRRSGRDDLVARVECGELSINAALKLAYPQQAEPKPDALALLMKVWCVVSPEDREAFSLAVGMTGGHPIPGRAEPDSPEPTLNFRIPSSEHDPQGGRHELAIGDAC